MEGRKEGWKEGRMEGRKEGRKEGRREGRKEGWKEARKDGRETTYLMEFKLTLPKIVNIVAKQIIVEEKIEFILLGLSYLTFFVHFSDMGVWITPTSFCDSNSSSCFLGNH